MNKLPWIANPKREDKRRKEKKREEKRRKEKKREEKRRKEKKREERRREEESREKRRTVCICTGYVLQDVYIFGG